jgi:alpha-L-fucosidase
MKNHKRLLALAGALSLVAHAHAESIPITATPTVIVSTSAEPIPPGKFAPTWESLSQYQCPEWFRDAKFGIWAHLGPQCQPGAGDWYARHQCCQRQAARERGG